MVHELTLPNPLDVKAPHPLAASGKFSARTKQRGKHWRNMGPMRALSCFNVSRSDNFAPLDSFVRDELAEVSRRARKQHAAHIGEPCLDRGISEAGIDLPVEVFDNFG